MTTLITLTFLFCSSVGYSQNTEIKYLSGLDKDTEVEWEFYCTEGRKCGEWTTIKVPSNWEQEGFGNYNYGHDTNDPEITHNEKGMYRHSFMIPESWEDKFAEIVFEGSMTDTEVKINGQLAGPIHRGAFYEFKYDISGLLNYGEENLLEVEVSKMSSNQSVNAAERQADYWVFGGIFRPVYLQVKPAQHIDRWAVDAKADGSLSSNVYIKGDGNATTLTGQIKTLEGDNIGPEFSTELNENSEIQKLSTTIQNPELWSPEFPNLYHLELELKDAQGNTVHRETGRFGFRTVELRKGDGFYVNGQKIRFRGVNRHSFWPESGRTMSKELSIEDVNNMKDMNMNAVRMSHYPPDKHFLDVADSLGLFVINELAGWQDAYDTDVGKKLVKEMVVRDVNHPSIVIWSNGNEGGNNFDLVDDYARYDPQKRPLIHAWSIFRGTDTQHYKDFNCCTNTLFHGDDVFFPTEFLHGLYDGGHGAGLEDFWNLMRSKPLSAGGFLWVYADECVSRTDKGGELDCDGNHAPDGIVGPYHQKEGSFLAIKEIWSPVHVNQKLITEDWDGRLHVENRFFYTNLNQVDFRWELISLPGPFDSVKTEEIIHQGAVASPDVIPRGNGYLDFELPSNWKEADAFRLTATDPHGREIYTWSWSISKPKDWVQRTVSGTEDQSDSSLQETEDQFILTSDDVKVTIDKKSGYISHISKDGYTISLKDGPVLVGGDSEMEEIIAGNGKLKVSFAGEDFDITYAITSDGWLKVDYNYKPYGHRPYFGITFSYPEEYVNGIRWAGNGPYRVWKNRLAGMEYGLWEKDYNNAITGYRWEYPEFKGYHSRLNWAVLDTDEGSVTMMVTDPQIYLGLFRPEMPPIPANTRFEYPDGDLSFLHAISPIGTKFKEPEQLGPDSRPNIFQYPGDSGSHDYQNTLWLYFGDMENRR